MTPDAIVIAVATIAGACLGTYLSVYYAGHQAANDFKTEVAKEVAVIKVRVDEHERRLGKLEESV